jgi:hypothetical protein
LGSPFVRRSAGFVGCTLDGFFDIVQAIFDAFHAFFCHFAEVF